MKIDRTHIPWALMTLLATAVMALFYLATFHPRWLPLPFDLPQLLREAPRDRHTYGGTALGLIYGSLALLGFLFASALGIRKKKRLWRIGRVELWLKAHIWFSVLTIPLVAFHCGFQRGGPHTSGLLLLYALVMGSGFFGLTLQQFMPRMLKESLPQEVVYEQIPHIRRQLIAAAEEMQKILMLAVEAAREPEPLAAPEPAGAAAAKAAPAAPVQPDPSVPVLGEFLVEECLPYLRLRRGTRHRLGDHRMSDDIFRLLKLNVTENYLRQLEAMQGWCDDRRMMDLQLKLHHWLHGWLLIHVPASFALIVWTVWHGFIEIEFL